MQHLLGQSCALLAALTWAMALILFKRSGERIPPIGLNLYKNVVGLVLLGLTLGFLVLFEPEHSFAQVWQFPLADFCILMLSGIIGIALADTLFFYALNLTGVGLVSIVDCSYSPLMLLFAWLMLAEKLTAIHYLGGALIIASIFFASRHELPENRTRRQLVGGMVLAVLAMGSMAFSVVLAKPIIEEMAVIWSAMIRLAAGTGMLALFALLGKSKNKNWAVFRPSSTWKFALPASVLGAYVAMIFWIAGFKYTYAPVAAVLNQTTVIFAIILATVFLKERFGKRTMAAIALALTGVVIVTFSDWLLAAWYKLLAAQTAA